MVFYFVAKAPWNVKGILKNYRKDEKEALKKAEKEKKRLQSLQDGSGRIVVTAVLMYVQISNKYFNKLNL